MTPPAAQTTLKTEPIDTVLGVNGQMVAGVYKVTVGRKTTVDGRPMGNAMGVNTWTAFAGSDEQAVVDGDFAMLESEVQPVLEALHRAGIDLLALHKSHAGRHTADRLSALLGLGAGGKPRPGPQVRA